MDTGVCIHGGTHDSPAPTSPSVTRSSKVVFGGFSFGSCEGGPGTRSGLSLLNRVALLTLSVWLLSLTTG